MARTPVSSSGRTASKPAVLASLVLASLGATIAEPASPPTPASASTVAGAIDPGVFARRHYRTPLAGVCPNPIVVQKDWLIQSEHGALYQLIGGAGRMSRGRYQGALGSTGIDLVVLEGGRGIGLGDAETAYSALYMGNSKAGVVPHLAFHDLDNAFIFSARFPAVGVVALLDKSPSVLLWDRATYPKGFHSLADLKAFAASGRGKIYVSTTKRTFGRYLLSQGIPNDAFMEGFRGDGETFVINNGTWLNQGAVTNEVYQFENGFNWRKPIDYLLVSNLGYDIYPSMLAVATSRLEELAPCLAKLVPLLQQAQVDYVTDPREVNDLIVRFADARMAAPFWKMPAALVENAVTVQRAIGLVGNGNNLTLGDFDLQRVAALLAKIRASLDVRAKKGVAPEDVVTNRFIDPRIGLPAKTGALPR